MNKTLFSFLTKRVNKKTVPNLASGFTLVETMFAVLILTFTISGMMSVIANSLFAARYSKDEITANYLLQEAVDYIRNDRDTTVFLSGSSDTTDTLWNNFYSKYSICSNSSTGCYFDVFSGSTPKVCSITSGCPYLYYNKNADTSPFYVSENTSGLEVTSFKRKVVVKPNALNPREIDITATVDWKNGGVNMSRSLKVSFMKWQ